MQNERNDGNIKQSNPLILLSYLMYHMKRIRRMEFILSFVLYLYLILVLQSAIITDIDVIKSRSSAFMGEKRM